MPVQQHMVMRSPFIDKIMQLVDAELPTSTSKAALARKIISIDRALEGKEQSILAFLRKLERGRKQKGTMLVEQYKEAHALDGVQFYDQVKSKAFQLGDSVMEEMVQEVTKMIVAGKKVPDAKKKTIMNWFFRFKEIDQRQEQIELAKKTDDRQSGLLATLLHTMIYSRSMDEGELELPPERVQIPNRYDLGQEQTQSSSD